MTALAGTTRLVMDVDGDGRPDTIAVVQGKRGATVTVRFADPRHKMQRFSFPADPSREDAICSLPDRLQAEGKGFALVDGRCDSIHFFWNEKTHRLDWRRS